MARSDEYRAAYDVAGTMVKELQAHSSTIAGLDKDGGIVGGSIVQQARQLMGSVAGDGHDLLGSAEELLEVLGDRVRACEAYEAALDRWEAATGDWHARKRAFLANPVTNRPPGMYPTRPPSPGPWAE